MAQITGKLIGLETTLAKLRTLPEKVTKRVLPKAIRAAGGPYTKAARALAPKTNRLLSRSMGLVIRRYKGGAVVAIIGQERNKTIKVKKLKSSGGISGKGFAAPIHLVDAPVKPHRIAATGGGLLRFSQGGAILYRRVTNHPGHPGANILDRAARSSRPSSQRAFEQKAAVEIEKEAAKP